MFLRSTSRKKDGKEHRYFSIVENKRVADGRVVQRHVLYLGEINSSQELAWRKSIEVFEDGQVRPSTLALFPADRCEAVIAEESVVRVRLSELELRRPRQWGACWLVVKLWGELELDRFWGERLSPSRNDLQLVAVEEAFKNLKGDLAVRPIFRRNEQRVEAHIFVSFLAYCLHVTLTERLRTLAPGLTTRSVLEKFAAVQMIDVH